MVVRIRSGLGGRGLKSKHPRLDELQADFGWTNEFLVRTERGNSMHARDWEVRATIDGRDMRFACYQVRRRGFIWNCAASWTEGMSGRHRRQAKRRLDQLVDVTLDPSVRRVLESIMHPSHARIEDGFQVGSFGLFWGAPGEPPPAETVVQLGEALAGMVTRVETVLSDPR